jgi:tyrosyl-tRNA synthetase
MENKYHERGIDKMVEINVPTTAITDDKLVNNQISILDLLAECKMIASHGEGRRLINIGAVFINNEQIADCSLEVSKDALQAGIEIRKGKKNQHRVVLSK